MRGVIFAPSDFERPSHRKNRVGYVCCKIHGENALCYFCTPASPKPLLKISRLLGSRVFNPQHPGVTHFIIHAYDYSPLAEKGIPAARRYAGLAPAVPHARHMPSHIYSMVGLWEESIASNASAIEIQPDYYHAADFSVYAHLQLAQDAKAKG